MILLSQNALNIVYFVESRVIFSKNIVFLSQKVDSVLSNSVDDDSDEMPLNVTFHLGLHRLPKYPLWGFFSTKGQY